VPEGGGWGSDLLAVEGLAVNWRWLWAPYGVELAPSISSQLVLHLSGRWAKRGKKGGGG
jgi:hypothetical protein